MQHPPNPTPLLIVFVLAVIAISGSKRKWRTLLIIVVWTVAGFALGLGFWLVFNNPEAGGSAAAFAMPIMGGGAAVKEIIAQRKTKKS